MERDALIPHIVFLLDHDLEPIDEAPPINVWDDVI